MSFVQTRDETGTISGSKLRIEVPAQETGPQRAVIVTAHAKGERPTVTLSCSGTNREISETGDETVSATQIFAVDPGFVPWAEAKVSGPGGSYDLVLSVAAV